MMNDQEKSDLSILAVKSANKGGKLSAESMERREGAEGNTEENRMRRTLSRGSVSPGLATVYGRQQRQVRRRSSPLYSTMSISNCSQRHSTG